LPKQRIKQLIEELGADVLVSNQPFWDNDLILQQKKIYLDIDIGKEMFVHVSILNNLNSISFPIESDLTPACVISTSGSTGTPKLVLMSENNILEHVIRMSELIELEEEESFLIACSPAFSMAITSLYCALLNGKTLCLISQKSLTSPNSSLKFIAEYNVTFIKTVPIYFEGLLKWMSNQAINLPSLRVVNLSGIPTKKNLVESTWEVLPDVRIISTYGTTEAFSSTFFEAKPSKILNSYNNLPAGKPFKGGKIHQLPHTDDDLFEIGVSGNNLMIGYVEKGVIVPIESV